MAFTQAAVILICLLGSSMAFDWNPCQNEATPSHYADIENVTLQPEEPAAGDTVHFGIKGQAKIDVAAGTIDIGVMYSGLPIYSETRDLCSMASCPIKKGDLTIAYDQYLPPIVPPGPFVVTMKATDTTGKELLCLEISFDVKPPVFPPAVKNAIGSLRAKSLLRGDA